MGSNDKKQGKPWWVDFIPVVITLFLMGVPNIFVKLAFVSMISSIWFYIVFGFAFFVALVNFVRNRLINYRNSIQDVILTHPPAKGARGRTARLEIERNFVADRYKEFEWRVTLRMPGGTHRTYDEGELPVDSVKIINISEPHCSNDGCEMSSYQALFGKFVYECPACGKTVKVVEDNHTLRNKISALAEKKIRDDGNLA